LSKSSVNLGDTVVRKGDVVIGKAFHYFASNIPQLSGFDFEDRTNFEENMLTSF